MKNTYIQLFVFSSLPFSIIHRNVFLQLYDEKWPKIFFFLQWNFDRKKKFDLLSFSFHKCWPISFTSLDLDWKVVLYEGIDKVNSSENICICYSPSLAEERNMQINFLCHNFSVQAQLLLLHGCKKKLSRFKSWVFLHRA